MFSAWFFAGLYPHEGASDLPLHVELVLGSRDDGDRLWYSFYYPLLELLSGGGDAEALRRATIGILAVAYGLRVAVTWLAFSFLRVGPFASGLGTLAASLAAPLSLTGCEYLYFGKLSPVLWHNSTSILAAPLALLLFASTCRMLAGDRPGGWAHVVQVLLVAGSGWAKPNYLLALVPALAIYCAVAVLLAARGRRAAAFTSLWRRAAPTGIAAVLVLLLQYALTYGGEGLRILDQRVTNVVSPFALWRGWEETYGINPAWAVFASLLTPLLVTLLIWRTARRRTPIVLAWLAVVVGLATFSLMAEALEDGTILHHGNWMWGAQTAHMVLFAVLLVAFAQQFRALPWPKWVAVGLVALQVLLGMRWIQTLLEGQSATLATVLGCAPGP